MKRVATYQVWAACQSCGSTDLECVGGTGSQWHHQCKECGELIALDKVSPWIEYRETN